MDSKASKKLKLQLLILRTQSGCEFAFKELFHSFKGLTYNYLKTLLNENDAEDAQQQVWLKVYQNISKLFSPYGFKRWLMQITHRVAVDHINKVNKFTASLDDDIENIEQLFENELTVQLPIDFKNLHTALNDLSFEHKEVILLFYWQEFTCIEIAQILNCSTGTVKSRLFHAREKLHFKKLLQIYK
jgi:RNA polymerase sigma-70 factor (ECF subfamily)